MVSTEESKFRLDDGKELYTKTWKPTGEPTAVAVFLHGFSDHCNRYDPLFQPLAEAGVLLHSFDQRGFGRSVASKAEKGLTGTREQYLADVALFIKAHLPSGPNPAPFFLMGHSMGGQGTLLFAAHGPEDVRKHITAYIALGPWIQLHPDSQPGWLKLRLGLAAEKVMPHFQLFSKLDPKFQCHDEKLCHDWDVDPLCHDTGTLEMFAGCLGAADDLHNGKVAFDKDIKLFLGHGSEDSCTSHVASKAFMDQLKMKDKVHKEYPGSYHCIHLEAEHGQKELIADILDFMQAGTTSGSAEQANMGTSKL